MTTNNVCGTNYPSAMWLRWQASQYRGPDPRGSGLMQRCINGSASKACAISAAPLSSLCVYFNCVFFVFTSGCASATCRRILTTYEPPRESRKDRNRHARREPEGPRLILDHIRLIK